MYLYHLEFFMLITGLFFQVKSLCIYPTAVPVRRCWMHSTSHCVVAGCHRIGQFHRPADDIGPAGRRCKVHGCGCRVSGCTKQTWGRSLANKLGPAGPACWLHGGKVCNVSGCQSQPRGIVKEQDFLGAPGVRCKPHLKLQAPSFGPKRCRDPFQNNLPELPEKERCCYANGSHWRCKRQRKDVTSKYCEHHEDLYQKRLHRMWLQRSWRKEGKGKAPEENGNPTAKTPYLNNNFSKKKRSPATREKCGC